MRRDQVASWVREQHVAPITKLVLLLIFDRCGEQQDGRWAAWPKLQTLADDAGIASVATIRKHIVALEDAGIVEREARYGHRGQTSSLIVLNVPDRPLPRERATPQPTPTGAGRPLPPERAIEGKPQLKHQMEEGDAPADARESLPEGFPAELRPHVIAVYRLLTPIAEAHNARRVWPQALGRLVLANRNKPLVAVAHELSVWSVDPPRPIKDVVATYATFLGKARTLQGVERLADDGAPSNVLQHRRPDKRTVRDEQRERWLAAAREGGLVE